MVKRNSKRWEVQPDYEPPITRLKARLDPSIVIPPIQPLPLPRRNRRNKVITPAAALLKQKEEENAAETQAQQAQSAVQMVEKTTTENRKEELMKGVREMDESSTGNQMEEMVTGNQTEEMLTGNQMEKVVTENQLAEIMAGCLLDRNTTTVAQMDSMAADSQSKVTAEGRPEELVEQNPTTFQGLIEGMNLGNQSEDSDAWSTMNQVVDPDDAWTEQDQKDLEAELEEEKKKHFRRCDRSYTWELIVGKHRRSEARSVAPYQECSSDGDSRAANNCSTGSQIAPTEKTVQVADLATMASVTTTGNSNECIDADAVSPIQSQSLGASIYSQRGADTEAMNELTPFAEDEEDLAIIESEYEAIEIFKERNFIENQLFEDDPVGELQFSIVSYSIMVETEKEEGEGSGKVGRKSGREDAPSELQPSSYNALLIAELYYLDPDVFCLQSIGLWYWKKLSTILYNWGYGGFKMQRRPGSFNCFDGIFFRLSRFELVKSDRTFLDDLITKQSMRPDVPYSPQISLSVASREVVTLAVLQCRLSGRKIRVVNTRCVPEFKQRADLQAAQICSILQGVATIEEQLPTVLCGNFDFPPGEGPYEILRDGDLKDEFTEQIFKTIESITVSPGNTSSLVSVYRPGFKHSLTTMRSAYETVLGIDPPNVWKRESQTLACGSYVWFQEDQMQVVGVLDMVSERAVDTSGIPNEFFPSGSLSLKAVFQLRNEAPDSEVRQ